MCILFCFEGLILIVFFVILFWTGTVADSGTDYTDIHNNTWYQKKTHAFELDMQKVAW